MFYVIWSESCSVYSRQGSFRSVHLKGEDGHAELKSPLIGEREVNGGKPSSLKDSGVYMSHLL
jgi:hypothetical protein